MHVLVYVSPEVLFLSWHNVCHLHDTYKIIKKIRLNKAPPGKTLHIKNKQKRQTKKQKKNKQTNKTKQNKTNKQTNKQTKQNKQTK